MSIRTWTWLGMELLVQWECTVFGMIMIIYKFIGRIWLTYTHCKDCIKVVRSLSNPGMELPPSEVWNSYITCRHLAFFFLALWPPMIAAINYQNSMVQIELSFYWFLFIGIVECLLQSLEAENMRKNKHTFLLLSYRIIICSFS